MRAACLRAAERAELDREAREAAALGGDPVERILVERFERERPGRPVGNGLERLGVERFADLAEQARDEPAPKTMKIAIPLAVAEGRPSRGARARR